MDAELQAAAAKCFSQSSWLPIPCPPRRPGKTLSSGLNLSSSPSSSAHFHSPSSSAHSHSPSHQRVIPWGPLTAFRKKKCRKAKEMWRSCSQCSSASSGDGRCIARSHRQGRPSLILVLFTFMYTSMAPSFLVCCPQGWEARREWLSGGSRIWGAIHQPMLTVSATLPSMTEGQAKP